MEERDREEGKKEINQAFYVPSPMILSRAGYSLSQVRICFLREKRNKTKQKTKLKQNKNPSTFSLFSWLEAGANPAHIYTRAQPCMRTG